MIPAFILAPLLRFVPALRSWLTIIAFAAGALLLLYLAYFVLDARAETERARSAAAEERQSHVRTILAFNEYRRFTDEALAAAKRAAESRAAVKRRIQPLREMSNAAPPSDDGPLPPVTERFLDGLRLEFRAAGIIGTDLAAADDPGRAPVVRSAADASGEAGLSEAGPGR